MHILFTPRDYIIMHNEGDESMAKVVGKYELYYLYNNHASQ